jgi:hypothetical protein
MKHSSFEPIIEAVCYAYDYGEDSTTKSQEVIEILFPLGSEVDKKTALRASYAILYHTLEIIKELECINVVSAVENSNPTLG